MKTTVSVILVALALGACVPEEDGDVSTTSSELLGPEVSWVKGSPPVTLGSTSTMFCFLTAVSGDFSALTDHVYLSWTTVPGQWTLTGSGNAAWATARCVSWSSLPGPLHPVLTSRSVDARTYSNGWVGTTTLFDSSRQFCWLTYFRGDQRYARGVRVTAPAPGTGDPTPWHVDIMSVTAESRGGATCADLAGNVNYHVPVLDVRAGTAWRELMNADDGVCMLQSAESLVNGASSRVIQYAGSWWALGSSRVDCLAYRPPTATCLPSSCGF